MEVEHWLLYKHKLEHFDGSDDLGELTMAMFNWLIEKGAIEIQHVYFEETECDEYGPRYTATVEYCD